MVLKKIRKRMKWLGRELPFILNVEITTRCNAACIFCGRVQAVRNGTRAVGDMPMPLAEKVGERFAETDAEKVSIEGLGEAILHPRFADITSIMREAAPRARIHTDTNGIALTPDILDTDLDTVCVSINAYRPETHSALVKASSLGQVESNVRRVLEAKGPNDPRVVVQIIDTALTRPKLESFKAYWQDADAVYVKRFMPLPHSTISDMTTREEEEYARLLGNENPPKRHPCIQPFGVMTVTKEGHVYPCCRGVWLHHTSPLCLGNVRTATMEEMFTDGRVEELQHRQLTEEAWGDEPCRNCNLWIPGNIFYDLGARWF